MTFREVKIETYGRVQGVRFRQFVKDTADSLSLNGYVNNLVDGSVLIVAQGEENVLKDFLMKIQKGSVLSKVEGMSYHFRDKTKEFENFEILIDKNFISDQKSSFVNLGKKILGIGKNIPNHIAVIPDGNRRWAKQKGLDELEGHRVGGAYEKMKSLIDESQKIGVKYFSIWVFSTENWKRSQRELDSLFEIIGNLLSSIEENLIKNKIKFRHIGRKDRLPKKLVDIVEHLEELTKDFDQFNFQLCIDYGGRDEIVRAVNKILKNGFNEIAENDLINYLDSHGIPDPDLIIRTSGDYRMSGFMPFQSAYSEFYFTDVHFPDFGPLQLREAVESFDKRKRRFGGN